MNKSTALRRIATALDALYRHGPYGNTPFSCTQLVLAGVDYPLADAYWDLLMADCSDYGSCLATLRLTSIGYPVPYPEELFEQRLLMLAWLHEMVRSGEFSRITHYKFTK